ncbi:T-protein [subsurface metagenome]
MGRWFTRFLVKEGKEVVITGRNQKKLRETGRQLGVKVAASNVEAVKSADVVLLSVPVDSFEEVVKQISPGINPGQAVVDITSIKVFPVEVMHRYIKRGVMLGVHPMFGPGARDIANQNFVLTPTSEEEETLAQRIKAYLETREARVTLMTPKEHDEMVAVTLGLSHFIAIASADALLSLDKSGKMGWVGGSTYKLLRVLIESVLSEDPELYASLQVNLPGIAEIEKLFQKSARTWAEIVASKDKQKFMDGMNVLKDKLNQLDPDFGKSYEKMYRIVEGL